MSITIGPRGFRNLYSVDEGARRPMRIVSFVGAAAAGPVAHTHFYPTASKFGLRTVIDMQDGKIRTAEFSDTGSIVGNLHITQLDTGASGHTCWAIITDTGT